LARNALEASAAFYLGIMTLWRACHRNYHLLKNDSVLKL